MTAPDIRVWARRDHALQAYHNRHPARFRTRPRTPRPAHQVGINLPDEQLTTPSE